MDMSLSLCVLSQEREISVMASKRERTHERESLIPKRFKPTKEDFIPLCSYPWYYYDEDHDASSVGSNQIIDEIGYNSDDEAESSPPKSEKSIQSTEFSASSEIPKSRGSFTKAVNEEEKERETEGSMMDDFLEISTEEERLFWVDYKSAIIGNNRNLLDEFSSLEDDLIIGE